MQKLPTLFSPTNVIAFDDKLVAALASEDEESAEERALAQEKLRVLEDGLKALKGVQQPPSDFKGMIALAKTTCLISC